MKDATLAFEIAFVAALSALCIGMHWSVFGHGLALTDSDMSWLAMESDRFLKWSRPSATTGLRSFEYPMYFHRIWYSGTWFGFLRAFWMSLWNGVGHSAPAFKTWMQSRTNLDFYPTGQMAFTYLAMPVLMLWASWYLARQYCSALSAGVVALVCAVGFETWIIRYGLDWYYGCYLLGCILLAQKPRHENPLLEASPQNVFIYALLSGLMLNLGRHSILYCLAFWVPWSMLPEWFRGTLLAARLPRQKPIQFLLALSAALFVLFLFTYVVTEDLGLVAGKHIKLQAVPNLKLSLLSAAMAMMVRHWQRLKNLKPLLLKQILFMILGLALGLGREIMFLFEPKTIWQKTKAWDQASGTQFVETLAHKLPPAFSHMVAAQPSNTTAFFSLFLFLVALATMVWQARSRRALRPIAVLGILCVLAFCQIRTFSPGHPRYLFCAFPVFIVALGVCFDSWRHNKIAFLVLLLLTGGHLSHQIETRFDALRLKSLQDAINQIKTINQAFLESGVDLVYSNEYWDSNTYTLASSQQLGYTSEALYPLAIAHRAEQHAKNQGPWGLLLFEKPGKPLLGVSTNGSASFYSDHGRSWALTPRKTILLNDGRKAHLFTGFLANNQNPDPF